MKLSKNTSRSHVLLAIIFGLFSVVVRESVAVGDLLDAPSSAPLVKTFDLIPSHKITKSAREMEALKESIRTKGMLHNPDEPIAYVIENGQKCIVDGHHRVRAAKELGITEIPAVEVKLPYKGYKTPNDLIDWER